MKEYLTGYTVANEARMRREVFKGSILLVEGDSDERLFGLLIDNDRCQIIICHGRQNLFDAAYQLEASAFPGILCIADSDFERLEGREPPHTNILYTDHHDAECMLLRGEGFERLISQFVSREKFANWCAEYGENVREHLLNESAVVGCLLWHSLTSGIGLGFDNLEIKEYADKERLTTRVDLLVEHVKNKSSRHDLSGDLLVKETLARREGCNDLWQVVRGHDFIDLLSFAFRYAWGSQAAQAVTRERLEQCLRLAFPVKEFASTRLFDSVQEWQRAKTPFRVLKTW